MTHPGFDWHHHHAMINGIRLHYVEQVADGPAEKPTVVLCHGFPMLWFSWHRQIPVLAEAGYRVIAPSMRGMGQSEAPEDPEAYGVDAITGDLVGLLDHCCVVRAIFVGIDFGAFAVQDLALRHPERVQAVICLENPAAPHNPDKPPLTEYREMGEQHFLHIEYFREPPRADVELAAAPREFLRKVMWLLSGAASYFEVFKHPPGTSYIDAMPEPPPLPWAWLSEVELEFFVSEYSQSGFTGGLNWYRAMDIHGPVYCNSIQNWALATSIKARMSSSSPGTSGKRSLNVSMIWPTLCAPLTCWRISPALSLSLIMPSG
jgi:pimeloyl-ACP methyl ester carboxylesterase